MTTQANQAGGKEARLAVEFVILRSGAGFTDGLCSGYLTYYHEVVGKPLTVTRGKKKNEVAGWALVARSLFTRREKT